MKKPSKKLIFKISRLSLALASRASATAACVAAYIKVSQADDGFYASVGLRSYFHCGTGTKDDPFVITRPRHLNNRARLQSLGIFDEKKYFQLGYNLGNDDKRYVYTSDSSSDITQILDRGNDSSFVSIGNESVPFYGEFDGNNLEISNLTVHASPEDTGRFGYVASEGKVRNLILDSLKVVADGYSGNFDSLYQENAWSSDNGTFSVTYGEEQATQKGFTGNYSDFRIELDQDHRPVFSFTAPAGKDDFTYSLLYSDVFATVSSDGKACSLRSGSEDSHNPINFFISEENRLEGTIADSRTATTTLSLIASTKDERGISHSKVINALDIAFQKATGNPEGNPVYRYVRVRPEAHGNNTGLVIGHLDGSCQNVYVHDGTFELNNSKDASMRKVVNNSTHGLIGKVGATVDDNAIADAGGATGTVGKDVGVLDYTDIYNSVVASSTGWDIDTNKANWYKYTPIKDNPYEEYLRYFTSDGEKSYYASKTNSIDLIGRNVIKDEPGKNRGLGVFTIGTDYGGTWVNEQRTRSAGSPLIAKRNSENSDDRKYIYYSTAEVTDFTNAALLRSVGFTAGQSYPNYNGDIQTYAPGYFLPSEISSKSREDNEKHYNYRFRFPLSATQSGFYLSNVDTSTLGGKYLSEYFNYKLIDKNGKPIPAGTSKCGIRIKNKTGGNITDLSANRRLVSSSNISDSTDNRPSDFNKRYVIPGEGGAKPSETDYTVSNTINFTIDSEHGANVTIVASNRESDNSKSKTSGSILGVYKLPDKLAPADQNSNYFVPDGISWSQPTYGRLLPSANRRQYYDVSKDGKVGKAETSGTSSSFTELTRTDNFRSSNAGRENTNTVPLIAHTFKLEKGRYCLGSYYGDCSVYYVCAQGQSDGDISLANNVTSQINRIDNIDFLKDSLSASGLLGYKITYNDDGTRLIPDERTLKDHRCFILFNPDDVSEFADRALTLEIKYDNGLIFTASDASALTNLSILNYAHRRLKDDSSYYTNIPVQIKAGSTVLVQGQNNELSYSFS